MFFKTISLSDVRPGDHLYRYRWLQIQEGIAVQFPKLSSIFVITTYKNTLRLVTLKEFRGRSFLRRFTHRQTVSLYRPPNEIVQNALLLLHWSNDSPDHVRALFSNNLSQFARRCCTTTHEQWQNLFHQTPNKHFVVKERVSPRNDVFNLALVCGMPFHRALHIGTKALKSGEYLENQSLLSDKDTTNYCFSSDT